MQYKVKAQLMYYFFPPDHSAKAAIAGNEEVRVGTRALLRHETDRAGVNTVTGAVQEYVSSLGRGGHALVIRACPISSVLTCRVLAVCAAQTGSEFLQQFYAGTA